MESSKSPAGARIRAVKYKPDWSQIPVEQLRKAQVKFEIDNETIRKSNPWCTEEELENWRTSEGTLGNLNPDTYSKIVRVSPKGTEHCPELRKIVEESKCDFISFVELPAGTGYPPHRDVHRTCNINFIRPSTDGQKVSPLVIGSETFHLDRFIFDPKPMHYVPALSTERFTMMLTFTKESYESVVQRLEQNGWL